ncbi:hypothetical protein EJ08DRAFT_580324 [Tothia fuscella]|uniref:Uncharacterized protein n=1 Tax=Tothia fuscella TaxID=1048955 RepID=A0A9P4U3Z9_9PEZI|nr:hypothetical protein EJ08DRAFT_580324 [Tothia fuscella]
MRRDADNALRQKEKRNDVFGAINNGVWPTVVVPPGFTLAAGVEITPLPGVTNTFVGGSPAQVTPAPSAGVATPVPQQAASISPAEWNAQAEQACMTSVMSLRGKATNPAGLAVCYNVPYLDQAKGVFEAELRLYNISAPSGDFLGVTPAMMMVTLQYQGATIQKSNGVLPVKRDTIALVERQMQMAGLATPTGTAMPNGILMPSEVAIRKYVGQVNKGLMMPGMNLTQFQPLLVPQISISGMSPTSNRLVNTSLSSTESSFVAGIFSRAAGNITDPKSLLGQPADQLAAAAAGKPTPFVVPGLSLAVFPVGLIITGMWVLLFATAVGLGTMGRIQFRHQYRLAIRAQKAEMQRRI